MVAGRSDSLSEASNSTVSVRPLAAADLDAVVDIDAKLAGRRRRDFFQRRLNAALAQPNDFVHVGAFVGSELKGYALVRLLAGEFGHDGSSVLDAIGVAPETRGTGLGRALLSTIDEMMHRKGIAELQTQTEWTNGDLLGFLAHAGFEHASRLVLQRDVATDLER